VIIVAALAASALGIIAVGDGPSYMTSNLSRKLLMKWSFIPYIFMRGCTRQTLVHSFLDQPRYHLLQPVALTRCPSVVIFILLQHRPSRLIVLQYSRAAFLSVSRLVNIPVGAFGRGLSIILLLNSNIVSFGHDLGRYAQSSSLGSCLNCLS
jgi:hypothetical protein